MAFDLGAMLANVSDSDTSREQIEYIDLTYLDDDPNNFYTLSGLDELADNIATCGLQQPIRVRRNPDVEGRYIIVSGHRRRAALDLLVKEDAVKWSEAPCIVERDDASPALQQLRLIYANAHTRKLTPAEISEEAVQVEKLLYQLKEEGHEFPGRMRDHVAKAVGSNTTKLARLKVIREGLTESWLARFQQNSLSESAAYELARLSPEYQAVFFDAYKRKPAKLEAYRITHLKGTFKDLEGLQCVTSRESVVCAHIDAMKKKCVRDENWWNNCEGCCKNCAHLKTCKYSCPKAENKKNKLIQKEKDSKSAADAKAADEAARVINRITEIYSRIKQARQAAGVSIKDFLKSAEITRDASTFKSNEDGIGITQYSDLPLSGHCRLYHLDGLCRTADALHCSVDFLLGRDVPRSMDGPVEPEKLAATVPIGWQSGSPDVPGEYAVFGHYLDGSPDVTSLEWKDDGWYEFDEPLMAFEVAMWTPFPEVK